MKKHFFLVLFTLLSSIATSQNSQVNGKIIKIFGQTFSVENPEIKTDTSTDLKVIFDVSNTSSKNNVINKNIVTAARFLNMHANEGMNLEQLKVAITIHGAAWIYNTEFGFISAIG